MRLRNGCGERRNCRGSLLGTMAREKGERAACRTSERYLHVIIASLMFRSAVGFSSHPWLRHYKCVSLCARVCVRSVCVPFENRGGSGAMCETISRKYINDINIHEVR